MKDRNPHANLGSNVGVVLAHLAVIGGGIALAVYFGQGSRDSLP